MQHKYTTSIVVPYDEHTAAAPAQTCSMCQVMQLLTLAVCNSSGMCQLNDTLPYSHCGLKVLIKSVLLLCVAAAGDGGDDDDEAATSSDMDMDEEAEADVSPKQLTLVILAGRTSALLAIAACKLVSAWLCKVDC